VATIDVPLTPEQADFLGWRSTGGGLLAPFIAALGETLVDVTGAEDLTIGVPVSQRSTPALQDTITCLIDTMCVRLRTRVAYESTVLGALRNNDLSIAEVARFAGLAGRQLYQVIGAVQDSPSAELPLDGCTVRPIELSCRRLHVPLLVELLADDGIASTVRVSYETASVTESTARKVSAGLVARLTRDRDSVRGGERRQLVERFTGTT
jgi:hypothetical protein